MHHANDIICGKAPAAVLLQSGVCCLTEEQAGVLLCLNLRFGRD